MNSETPEIDRARRRTPLADEPRRCGIWVENTTRHFKDGHNYFGRYPKRVLPFFGKYMKSATVREQKIGAAGR